MAIDSEATPDGVIISNTEMRTHMNRVETLCTLLEGMIGALSSNPMFAAMIPPDLLKQAKSL